MNDDDFDPTSEPQGPPAPQPPAPPDALEPWDQSSEIRLSKLNSALAHVNEREQSSYFDPRTADNLRGQIEEQRRPLLAKKNSWEQMAKQKAVADAHEQAAIAEGIDAQNEDARSANFPKLTQTIVDPFTGKTATFARTKPGHFEQVDFGQPEGVPEGGAMPSGTPETGGETSDIPLSHTLTINGQDFNYTRGANGRWQQQGFQGGPTQAEIEAEHQFQQGGFVDPGLAQRAMLDRKAREMGAVLPAGVPHDGHAEAASAAGSLSNAEIAQNRSKAMMALGQAGIHPGSRGFARALADQVHLFNSATLREKQHVADAQRANERAQQHEAALKDREERKTQDKEKNDGYEQNIKHFIDKLNDERRHNQDKGYEQPEYVKDAVSIHEEAEKRAAEVFKSKHGHYPEGFLKKQQAEPAAGESQAASVSKTPTLPVIPAGAADLPALLAEKKRREQLKQPPPAVDPTAPVFQSGGF